MIDDLDRVMQVMKAAFDPAFGEAWTRGQVESALLMGICHVTLVDEYGKVPAEGAAAAGFSLVRSIAGEDELLLFAVDPRHRRRGLGTRLLDMVLADSRNRGCKLIHLEMRQGNPAEQLYLARGFVPVGRRPNYYRSASGDRLDAISFCYEL
jgi:[ribosomal protein S18]-alanine N-acetyltransferase